MQGDTENSRINGNSQYKISVVIPAYNREKTIRRCIDSIINQTEPVFEIIVVDDGSTDQTIHILETEYADEVKVIKQIHKGAQAARNAGIYAAKGKYIAFQDSDDEWLPDKIELQMEALKKDENAVVCGEGYIQRNWENGVPEVYKRIGQNKQGMFRTRELLKNGGKSGYVYKDILNRSFCLFQTMLTSKKNLTDINVLDEKVPAYQEWDTAIRLAKNCNFIYIRKPLFIYYLHDGETISKSTKKDIDGLEYILEKHQYEILSQLGKGELERRYKNIAEKCAYYKDKRMFRYFVKYILAKQNLFIFKENIYR